MSEEVRKLLEKLLVLSPEERAEIANSLLESLDDASDVDPAEHDDAWAQELTKRLADIDSGKVTPVPWEEVRERILRGLTKR